MNMKRLYTHICDEKFNISKEIRFSYSLFDTSAGKNARKRAFFNEVFLAAREVMLRIVKLLRSEVSAEVGRVFLLIVFVHCRNNA